MAMWLPYHAQSVREIQITQNREETGVRSSYSLCTLTSRGNIRSLYSEYKVLIFPLITRDGLPVNVGGT